MKKNELTTSDIERGYEDDGWLGWGYLGGRQALSPTDRAYADRLVLTHANREGWTYDQLFRWMNSRPGRHFADDPTHTHAARCLNADLDR